MMKRKKGALGVIVSIALLLAATACGSSGGARGEPATITVGVQPNTSFAVVPFGVEKGFFKQVGLDIEVKKITTATTIPPALLAGQLQFSNWSFPSFATLAGQGLPLKIVGAGDTTGGSLANDYIQLVALEQSRFTSVADLKGKTIAVNSLASLSEVQVKIALTNAGVNPADVKLIPIPFPDQLAALTSRRVDAIGSAEPFLTLTAAKEDIVRLAPLDAAVMPDMPLSLWMTSAKFLADHPDTVHAFQRALIMSLEYARDHEAEFRAFIPGFSGVSTDIAEKMILPTWTTSIDEGKAQVLAEIMHQYGAVDTVPTMKDFIIEFPPKG
ncbi:ABC transporter substrate-binding protein [Nocardia sp. NPDC049707]|uniref:ABC transporter substrate-binding protein n=1 Tax=Nocardia sp. NPDC049707 TaxID=3154735 RepID=UPI0034379973